MSLERKGLVGSFHSKVDLRVHPSGPGEASGGHSAEEGPEEHAEQKEEHETAHPKQGAQAAAPPARPRRPAEPLVENALDVMELQALVRQGMVDVEVTMLRAGALGGMGRRAFVLWTVAAVAAAIWGIVLMSVRLPPPEGYDNDAWYYVLAVPGIVMCFAIAGFLCLRLYYMTRRRLLAAYRMLQLACYSAVGIVLTYTLDTALKRPVTHPFEVGSYSYEHGCIQARLQSLIWGVLSLSLLQVSYFLHYRKRVQVTISVLRFSLLWEVFLVVQYVVNPTCPGSTHAYDQWPQTSFLFVVNAIGSFLLYRQLQKVRRKALTLIEKDRHKYTEMWDELVRSEGEALDDMEAEVKLCKEQMQADLQLDQYGDLEDPRALVKEVRALLQRTAHGASDTSRPRQRISDLAVLYAQAGRLNGIFHARVVEWASHSGGTAPREAIHVKRRVRAIEKLHRSYGKDPGLLIDLVRSTIHFANVADLKRCLQMIRNDSSAAILQIKNRLSKSVHVPTGYRNVSLSLVLVNEKTMDAGVDAHVVELQLGLEKFDRLKTEGGHRRYVAWRDMLAQ